MKEIRNILGWLGMAEERSLLEDAKSHVEETYKTITYFSEAVKAFINGDLSAKISAIEKVRESEHQADILRTKMISELSESLLMPPDREDMMHFVKSLDRIADWTNGAARLLGYIEQRPPDNVLKNISKATEIITQSIAKLKDGIRAVSQNDLKQALKDCEDVCRFEHDADDQKKMIIESLIHAKLDPVTFFLSYQLADYLEGVTDKIEDASDFIKVIAVTSK